MNQIAERIRALKLDGFGSRCLAAAKTINKKVFRGRGKLVAVANKFWLKRGRFIGHVAVLFDGSFWDADGRPKNYDDLEEWGMLDAEDPDYFAPGWDENAAYKTQRLNGLTTIQRAWKTRLPSRKRKLRSVRRR